MPSSRVDLSFGSCVSTNSHYGMGLTVTALLKLVPSSTFAKKGSPLYVQIEASNIEATMREVMGEEVDRKLLYPPGVYFKPEKGIVSFPYNLYPSYGFTPPFKPVVGIQALLKKTKLKSWVPDFMLPHQIEALSLSAQRVGYTVWSRTGSGKTLIALGRMALGDLTLNPNPKLVITRAAARDTWVEEIRKYTDYEVVQLLGEKAVEFEFDNNTIYVTAYETLTSWGKTLSACPKLGTVVFDEVHVLKAGRGVKAVTQADGSIEFSGRENTTDYAGRIAGNSSIRFGLTATPVANLLIDLHNQLSVIEPFVWGSRHSFGMRYCDGNKAKFGYEYKGRSNLTELKSRLSLSTYQANNAALLASLPPVRRQVTRLAVSEQDLSWRPDKNQVKAAKDTGEIEGENSGLFELQLAVAANRKRKYVCTRAVEAARDGQKVVIFLGRRAEVNKYEEFILKELKSLDVQTPGMFVPKSAFSFAAGVPVFKASGEDSQTNRTIIRQDYMSWTEKTGAILIATGDSMGESVNLQDTDLAIFAHLPWTPRQIEQWEGRFPRLGQKRPVLLLYVLAKATVDERVGELVLNKLPAVGEIANSTVAQQLEIELNDTGLSADDGSLLAAMLSGIDGSNFA